MLFVPLGYWAPLKVITTIARVHTVVAVLLVVLWIPAVVVPNDGAPFVLNTFAVAAATAVIGWPARVAWVYVLALATVGGVVRYVGMGARDWILPFEDWLTMVGFCTIIASLLIVTVRAGSTQDALLQEALRDARIAAAAESRARQRSRFGSLVHDDVITTLLAAARSTVLTPLIVETAKRTLHRIQDFAAGELASRDIAPDLLAVEVRSISGESADDVAVSGTFESFRGVIPGPAALAVIGAVGEALRNSARHATKSDGAVRRSVILASTPAAISVTVNDDGQGFDPARVPAQRLGIRSSIVDRMAQVTGGSASVRSAPGTGTTVELAWSRGAQ